MYITPVDKVLYFRAKTTEEDDKKRVSQRDVAVATGATGATGSAIASKGSFKSFSEVNKKINTTTREVKNSVELASSTVKEAKGVFGQFVNNCHHYKNRIIQFGQNVTNSKFLKPILTSKAYKGFAGFLGGAAAGLVTISGVGEMTNTFAKKAQQLSQG